MTDYEALSRAALVERLRALEAKVADEESQRGEQSEQATRRLAAIVENSGDAIISKNLEGIIGSWNQGAQELFGYTAEEIIGQSVLTIIPPSRHGEELEILKQVREDRRINHYETVRQRKDGKLVDVSLSVSPIKDKEGRIVGVSKIVRDISERKRHQAALRDSEERLRAILDTAVEGIITIDERGIIESVNDAAKKIFGYEAEELLGQNVKILMPNPYRREHDGYLTNYGQTGHARIIGIGREVEGQRKDGTVFPMDLSVSEVQLEGRRLFTGFVRDITERKRLEREILDVSERERRGIGHTLHDGLSQHLAGIELMSRVLEQQLSKKSKAGSAQAAKIAEHVREAIGQTRMLARGLSPVSIETNGLMSALQELADSVSRMFGIECRFKCPEPILIGDNVVGTHLYRIAQEAINNGIKHGKAKKVEVNLLRNHSGLIQLVVTDFGAGFRKGGSHNGGMGLQIMKYRASMIGASLEVRACEPEGVQVTCTLKAEP